MTFSSLFQSKPDPSFELEDYGGEVIPPPRGVNSEDIFLNSIASSDDGLVEM